MLLCTTTSFRRCYSSYLLLVVVDVFSFSLQEASAAG